jgi:diguanylate cyclase (GGDEF)-like protein/hemerythrin-like metal-binding protein/PAS domain S-box-containing protein
MNPRSRFRPDPSLPRPGRLSRRFAWIRSLRFLAVGLCLGAGLLAAPPERVTLQLKWRHQFQFAGYYAAQEKGYYRDAGLDVDIVEARPAMDPIREVTEGRAQYGVSNSGLLLARQRGLPVVVLAAIFQHSPLVLIARADSGIDSIHDLAGRRVMLERHSEELFAYLKKEGVPLPSLQVQDHSFDAADMLLGKVEAISAYGTDEPYFLEQAGFKYMTFTPRTAGIDFYGDNLFTTETELRAHPARVQAFREASLKGWKYAMQHPEELSDLILSQYGREHDREHLLFEARQMEALVQPLLVEMGYMNEGRWQHIAETYADLGLLPRPYSLQGFLYDPDAREQLLRRRMKLALTLILPILAFLGMVILVFLRLNRRLSGAIQAQLELGDVIKANERQFRFIAEHATDVIWTMDIASERFTYMSPSVFALRGYTPEEVMAQPATAALTPTSAALVRRELESAAAEWQAGKPVAPRVTEVEQPHKNGHVVATEVVTTLHGDPEGRLVSILGVTRDITERKRVEAVLLHELESLEQLASTDVLTSAWNRRHFVEAVEGEMHRSNRYGHPLSLVLLDIDHFKRVNDTCGHAVGDRVLQELADCVRTAIRQSDSLTRWGGEEFIVLMPNTGLSSALILAERIREGIASQAFAGVGQVTASFGLAEYLPASSLEEWLERVDQAMYRAKSEGRNRVVVDPARNAFHAATEHQEGSFLKLVWSETYCSGHRVIDAQHRHLFHLANELLDSMLTGRPTDEISMFVAGLLSEVVQHFYDEEVILAELGYLGLHEHQQKHAFLVAKALEMGREFRAGTLSVGSLFQFLAHDVVATHMLKEDREFFHLTAAP